MRKAHEDVLKNHFSKILTDDLDIGFAPYFIGQEKCSPNKAKTCHVFDDQYTFHYILSGAGYLTNGKKRIRLKANDIFFYPPNVGGINDGKQYYPDKDDPWEYIWLNLKGEHVVNFLNLIRLTPENNYYSVQNPSEIRGDLIQMTSVARNTVKRNASVYLPYIVNVFSKIADERISSAPTLTKKEIQIKKIIEEVEKSYTDPDFSLKKIADKLFYSPSYVSRIFHSVMHVTLAEHVTSLRMLKARDMLHSGQFIIKEIAEEVGYKSQFYFSKEFKKYFGVSPSKYEKR
ncbi:MAG: helix-turn-helix domain-containing protein [Candidatus Borkfalkiaceae bacterium]|nr:helix-turn-helix domain-containing protein [Christensenellaceae bacterium]